jgi:hypothetical protein
MWGIQPFQILLEEKTLPISLGNLHMVKLKFSALSLPSVGSVQAFRIDSIPGVRII